MEPNKFRALVVDDDLAVQKLTMRALTQQGFKCDCAEDGQQAAQMANEVHYDAVVTDLKMPNMNGHALSLLLLQLKNRPLLVVQTGVVEPRIVKDLFLRGVDDIYFKPVEQAILAAKLKAMVERRHQLHDGAASESGATGGNLPTDDQNAIAIGLGRLGRSLAEVAQILPISNVALDVYDMSRDEKWDACQIAAAIQRDASLTTEILRFANSSFYNPSARQIVLLDEAVLRIGQRKVGELALAASTHSALTSEKLPWLDLDLTWKRSMASGVILESLVRCNGYHGIEDGLMLSAIMHPLGRVILGMLFPQNYELIVERCKHTGEALEDLERQLFPTSHTEILGHLLASWQIAPELYLPLKFSSNDLSFIARLPEPMRTKAELVKVSIMLGHLAVNRWEDWDLLQLPTSRSLRRLNIRNVGETIRQSMSDVSQLAQFRPNGRKRACGPVRRADALKIAYCNLLSDAPDLLPFVLESLGCQVSKLSIRDIERQQLSIINCLGVGLKMVPEPQNMVNTVFVTDDENEHADRLSPQVLRLPISYNRMRNGLNQLVNREKRRRANAESSQVCINA